MKQSLGYRQFKFSQRIPNKKFRQLNIEKYKKINLKRRILYLENENSVAEKELELKKFYMVSLEAGTVISGMLIAKNEHLIDGEPKRSYRFLFGKEKYADLYEDEITSIQLIDPNIRKEFFAGIQAQYDVQCLDDEDNVLPSDRIIGNFLFDKEAWDNLHEEEKKDLVFMLQLSPDEIVEILNVIIDYKNENKKLYDQRKSTLDAVLDFMNNFDEIKDTIPLFSGVAGYLYKKSGIDTLINTITR